MVERYPAAETRIAEKVSLGGLASPHVALTSLVEDPLVYVTDVDAALARALVEELLPLVQRPRHLTLEVLRLALQECEVGEDRGHPRLDGVGLQRARLVELDLIPGRDRRIGWIRRARLRRERNGTERESERCEEGDHGTVHATSFGPNRA